MWGGFQATKKKTWIRHWNRCNNTSDNTKSIHNDYNTTRHISTISTTVSKDDNYLSLDEHKHVKLHQWNVWTVVHI